MVFKKPNWGPPPENYIAGLGRGASGFVTRADYGPSKVGVATVGGQPVDLQGGVQQSQIKQAPTAALRELTSLGKQGPEKEDYSDANYDEWSGYGGSLFAGNTNDIEDVEADKVFAKIDDFMDNRRKRKREEKLKEEEKKLQKNQKDYQAQFTDLKRQLANISRNEWEALPDAPDLVKRSKKQRESYQRYTPVPDTVINSARTDTQSAQFIDPQNMIDGTQTVNNLTELGQARGQLLSIKLDKASSESVVSKTPSFNKEGYMTDLNSLSFNSVHEIKQEYNQQQNTYSDIKKARALLKSVITNNPKSASGWIAAARVEELDGKIQQARNIMAQACQNFLDNEDIWLEAARLSVNFYIYNQHNKQPPEKTKALLAKAVSQMPKSKKLWLQASRKEQDTEIRKQILEKALEQIPGDIEIWKETIQLANPEEAKSLLYQATKNVPQSTELWLALAKLETYDNARVVLREAQEKLPTDHTIWVHAAKLEEAQGNNEKVGTLLRRAIKKLESYQVKIKRDQWLKEAVQAEESGSIVTCRAIIKETMNYGMDDYIGSSTDQKEINKQNKRVWIENAEACVQQSAFETARAIYFNAISIFPEKKSLWFNAIKLEEDYGSKQNLKDILVRAKDATKHIFFYLKLAKHLWKQLGQAEETRQVLNEGYNNHPDSEDIVLALQKFERENKNYKEASKILDQARQTIPNDKIHMQAVQLQREIGNIDKALELVNESLGQYRSYYKLWLIKAQLLEQLGNFEESRKTYDEALQIEEIKLQKNVWLNYAQFETNQEAYTRARTILQKGRIRMPTDDDIWLASIRLEIKSDNIKIAQNLMSQALQKCSTSGRLWALQIELEPAATRKSQVMVALKNNDSDSDLFLAISKVFWTERKGEKIKKWIQNAVTINKDNGDAWAHYLRYEMEFGNAESQKEVIEKFKEAEPHHGEMWTKEFKKVENWRQKPEIILKKIAKEIKLFEQI